MRELKPCEDEYAFEERARQGESHLSENRKRQYHQQPYGAASGNGIKQIPDGLSHSIAL